MIFPQMVTSLPGGGTTTLGGETAISGGGTPNTGGGTPFRPVPAEFNHWNRLNRRKYSTITPD